MSDFTTTHLEAAIIDQSAAGVFSGKAYAFVAVTCGNEWQLGVAVANEAGYNPIPKTFKSQREAKEWAEGLNRHIGRNDESVIAIICSTMGGRRVETV
ncbi:hypothetical protein [Bradyrhizobium sp. 150]|uniref:hypothetical protein n=1 Tax=Bradyrhizobium sp. 150 TaxID=2782625 RepID=UPI001FF94FE5|nr:hypothetical protein [Bradyrhizobium sp. 150]MCK1671086.1 hypothetical protein [Bradyrhizobium sp. 150]